MAPVRIRELDLSLFHFMTHSDEISRQDLSYVSFWFYLVQSCLWPNCPMHLATLPIAIFSEHYNARKYPLLFGQFFLAASQVMLMEVPTYWLMVIARVIQGISSSVVWVVGLALL